MKHKKLIAWLLFVWLVSGCQERGTQPPIQTADEQAAPKAHEEVLVPGDSTSPGEDKFTFPIVWLTPVVSNLNLRAEPDTSSQVVNQFQFQGMVKWTGNISDHQDKISIRGNARSLPWLEVTNFDGLRPVSWVYAGGVRPVWIDFGYDKQLPDSAITNPWIRLEPIDSMRFIQKKNQKSIQNLVQWVDINHDSIRHDGKPVEIAIGAKTRVFQDHLNMGEGYLNHTYLGLQNGWHIISRMEWEHSDFLLVRASDGLEFQTMGSGNYRPLASANKKYWAFPSNECYQFGSGIEIVNLDTQQSFVITSCMADDIIWANDQEIYFKTSDGYSTSYYRLKFSQLFN